MRKLDKDVNEMQISRIAENIYRQRISQNLSGTDKDDWNQAVDLIKSK